MVQEFPNLPGFMDTGEPLIYDEQTWQCGGLTNGELAAERAEIIKYDEEWERNLWENDAPMYFDTFLDQAARDAQVADNETVSDDLVTAIINFYVEDFMREYRNSFCGKIDKDLERIQKEIIVFINKVLVGMCLNLLSDEDQGNVGTALAELHKNAILHGHCRDPERVITTNVQVLTYPVHNGIYSVIRIEDEGDGFDYEKMVDPTQEAHLEDAMGRGILMTREIFTDGLVYPTDGSVALMWKKVGETGVGKSKTETPKRTLSP